MTTYDFPMHKVASRPCAEVVDGLDRVAEVVAAYMGLHFPESRRRDLLRGAQALADEYGCGNIEALLRLLRAGSLSDRQIEILTSYITVGETYFFREMKSLDAFRNHLIPELIRLRSGGNQRLRIWSAGCSTGEEAYTIAMILADLIPDLKAWNIHILGTDINPRAIEKARRGIYKEWSFRGLTRTMRERYFEPRGDKEFAVRSRFKDMVSFAHLNLAADSYPSLHNDTNGMDVIFCRNVLMYFLPKKAQEVIHRFQQCLTAGGWCIVAPSEIPMLTASDLKPISFDGATLYRKEQQPHTRTPSSMTATFAPPPEAAIWRFGPPIVVPEKPVSLPTAPAQKPQPHPAPPAEYQQPFPPAPAQQQPLPTTPASQGPVPDLYEAALEAYRAKQHAQAGDMLRLLFDSDGFQPRGAQGGAAFALMARIEADQGRLELAGVWADKAIAADKVNPGYHYLLSTVLEELGRPDDAARALKHAIYLDSDFILAHFALGNIFLRENGRKRADRHFTNAAALLNCLPKDEVLAESGGVTAGRLLEVIQSICPEGSHEHNGKRI